MRHLGEKFGYYVPVTPLTGRVECNSGDRKTCIWTLHSTNKTRWDIKVLIALWQDKKSKGKWIIKQSSQLCVTLLTTCKYIYL